MWQKLLEQPAVQKWLADWWKNAQKDLPAIWSASFRTQKLSECLWASAKAAREEAQQGLEERGGVGGLLTGWVAGDVSARLMWSDIKQRVAGAWRVGVVDTELLEAFQVYLAHEHNISVYRAQGVLVMKILEREAELLLSRLPSFRRAQLTEMAVKIRDAGLRTGDLTRSDPNCGQCTRKLAPSLKGGDCCGGMVFLAWDEVDAVFRVLLGERAPVPLTFTGDPTRCGFLGDTGCALTPGSRPTVCTAYYCAPYKEELARTERWTELSQALLELNDGRRGMNFRLNLSRRFVLHEKTKAHSTHPLDFVWDRLRLSGAEIGAAGKRQDANRLNVVP